MKDEPVIQVDNRNFVRFSVPVKLSEDAIRELVETLYVKGGLNLSVKRLQETFEEHDKMFGKRSGGPSRKWTNEERKKVLMTVDEDTDTVGGKLGRSGMSIYMSRARVLAEFQAWQMEHSDKLALPREQQIDAFIEDIYGGVE